MSNGSRLLFKVGVIAILVIAFVAYGFQRARTFMDGPNISITIPKNGESVLSSELKIDGTVANIALLYLNGRQIFTDTDGHFQENLLLSKGYNQIEISGKDKFGRETSVKREIMLK